MTSEVSRCRIHREQNVTTGYGAIDSPEFFVEPGAGGRLKDGNPCGTCPLGSRGLPQRYARWST